MKVRHFIAVYGSKEVGRRYALHIVNPTKDDMKDFVEKVDQNFRHYDIAYHNVFTESESFDSVNELSLFFTDVEEIVQIDEFIKKIILSTLKISFENKKVEQSVSMKKKYYTDVENLKVVMEGKTTFKSSTNFKDYEIFINAHINNLKQNGKYDRMLNLSETKKQNVNIIFEKIGKPFVSLREMKGFQY